MAESSKRFTPPKPKENEAEALIGQQEQTAEKQADEATPEELASRMSNGDPSAYHLGEDGPSTPTPMRQFGPDGKLYDMPTHPQLPPMEAPEGAKAGVVSAFVIIQERDGRFWATNDLSVVARLDCDRQSTTFDMIPACSQVISDVEMMKNVQNTVNAMAQTGAAMQEQQRVMKMQEKLSAKGIHIPR